MRNICCVLTVGSLLALVGCGTQSASPIPLVKVTGAVTIDGSPLTNGTVTFMPVSGTQSAAGDIVDGKYVLSTFAKNDGVTPGEYKVAVAAWTTEPGMGVEGVPAIPKKYFDSNKSGVTIVVTSDGTQVHDIPLTK